MAKKIFVAILAVFAVMTAAKAQPAGFVDGIICSIEFVDGDEHAFVDVNGDMIWDRRVNIRRIADEYKIGQCHCFKVGETISYGLQRGMYEKQVRMYRENGENPANYGYGMGAVYGGGYPVGGYPMGAGYPMGGGSTVGGSITIGGVTVGGSTSTYGGQRRVSGGVNVNAGGVHVNAGGSTVVRRSQPQQPQAQQPRQSSQREISLQELMAL